MAHVRALTAAWAAWAWLTAIAYLAGPEISHLQPIVAMVSPQWWSWLWGTAAALLTLGLAPWRGAELRGAPARPRHPHHGARHPRFRHRRRMRPAGR